MVMMRLVGWVSMLDIIMTPKKSKTEKAKYTSDYIDEDGIFSWCDFFFVMVKYGTAVHGNGDHGR